MNSGIIKAIIIILLVSFGIIVFISLRNFGSLQYPNISTRDIAEVCNIEEKRITMHKEDDLLEFEYTLPDYEIFSQSIQIKVGPTSKKHLNQIKETQMENDLKEYPNMGDGAFIYTFHQPPWSRTLWIPSGDTTYRIQSIISGCDNDDKLIEIAERIMLKNSPHF